MDPLTWLFALEQFGIKFGLDNISAIVARLGHPERAFRSVHVAGTNGKGSVTAMVDAALRAAGHRSARYTSPHLVDLAERFVIDGRPVAGDALAAAVADVRDAIDDLRARRRARGAADVLRSHDGGRRSSCSAAPASRSRCSRSGSAAGSTPPTSSRRRTGRHGDHVDRASITSSISARRCARSRSRRPASSSRACRSSSDRCAPEAAAAIAEVAREPRRATSIRDERARRATASTIGLAGAHQRSNAAVAVAPAASSLDARGIAVPRAGDRAPGWRDPQWPGRLDLRRLRGRPRAAARRRAQPGRRRRARVLPQADGGEPRPLVFAAMRDKDVAGMFAALLPAVEPSRRHARVEPALGRSGAAGSNRRARSRRRCRSRSRRRSTTRSTPPGAPSPRIVVAGSIFLLGDVMKRVGGS